MKTLTNRILRSAFYVLGIPLIFTSIGYGSVIIFDQVTTLNTAVYLKVQTKGRFFSEGGKRVDIYVNDEKTKRILNSASRVIHAGWQKDTVPFYAAMDLVVLPSYREGFANVTLEAAAMKLPVVTTDTVGCRDGTLDGQTGLLVPIGDTAALTDALEGLIEDADLRRKFGAVGRARVERQFDQRKLWPLYVQLYASLLRERCPHLEFEMNLEGESA